MDKETSSAGNFFQNLFSSLFKTNTAEAERKRRLKAIAKKLSKSKYNKFYKYSGNEALPQLARFFFDIYKAVSSAGVIFDSFQNQSIFKRIILNFGLTEEQKKLEEHIEEEYITAAAKTMPIAELREQVNQNLAKYVEYFSADQIVYIDSLYRQLMAFKDFCTYDYYFMLKKFDSSLQERNYTSTPHFEKISAEYIADDLKDFIAVAWSLPFDADWTALFKMLKEMKGAEPIAHAVWKKIITRMQTIKNSSVFEMIIRLASNDPTYTPQVAAQAANIVEPYLDKLKLETAAALQKIVSRERESKANSLLDQLFGTTVILQLKNYTEQASAVLERKGIAGYKYYQPLNYLKAFLIEIFKKDMREYYDIVFVRGKWETQALCTPVSNAYHELMLISDSITKFDAELAEDGVIGIKIKTLMPKTERDREAKNILNRLTGTSNDTARSYLIDSTKNVVLIGKTLKNLIDDEGKQKPELLINWKELEHFSETPLREFGVALYKKIYLFTCLMQTCMASN